MQIKFFFAWYDLWIGAYWSKQKETLYICPLPCCVIALQFIPSDIVRAPFSPSEVASLDGYQRCGIGHPYTCGIDSDDVLVATRDGLYCPKHKTNQTWAHRFTADWSWKKQMDETYGILEEMR